MTRRAAADDVKFDLALRARESAARERRAPTLHKGSATTPSRKEAPERDSSDFRSAIHAMEPSCRRAPQALTAACPTTALL
ncbi:hypothetical protein HPB50_026299 [Hyalomma asiaticum]|uniref:Uncharacterized protein n=1 Tax=Hyalomma asiaticum TaxID=266040 RepID=A0ACB7TRT9_HYAAI|nr:hypothetical protein HPB50_026299 [Hyalomma asiaticum]